MYNNDTELLFPSRVIAALEGLRGLAWDELVKYVIALPEDAIEHQAFVLMMTKLNGCNTCNSDSFRAMRGCTACSIQNVRRYRNSDNHLTGIYEKAKNDMTRAAETRQRRQSKK
jgi:hypothetical protein